MSAWTLWACPQQHTGPVGLGRRQTSANGTLPQMRAPLRTSARLSRRCCGVGRGRSSWWPLRAARCCCCARPPRETPAVAEGGTLRCAPRLRVVAALAAVGPAPEGARCWPGLRRTCLRAARRGTSLSGCWTWKRMTILCCRCQAARPRARRPRGWRASLGTPIAACSRPRRRTAAWRCLSAPALQRARHPAVAGPAAPRRRCLRPRQPGVEAAARWGLRGRGLATAATTTPPKTGERPGASR